MIKDLLPIFSIKNLKDFYDPRPGKIINRTLANGKNIKEIFVEKLIERMVPLSYAKASTMSPEGAIKMFPTKKS